MVQSPRTRIFDCFTFNDELMLLKLRLILLAPVVDRFVLVEADSTFQGLPKPLVFEEHIKEFSAWQGKITHVAVRDMPTGGGAWNREHHQRRAILRGLGGADPTDTAIISDVDEIPDPEAIKRLMREPPNEPLALDMQLFYYCLDLRHSEPWRLARACLIRDLGDPDQLRASGAGGVLPDAGWHFSWLLPEANAPKKLEAFSHTEYNEPRFKSPPHLRRCRELGVDLFGRSMLNPVPLNQLPKQVRALGRSRPELIHGPRGPWDWFLARCYLVSIRGSSFLPVGVRDRHPILSFVAAVPVRMVAVAARLLTWPARIAARRTHPSWRGIGREH